MRTINHRLAWAFLVSAVDVALEIVTCVGWFSVDFRCATTSCQDCTEERIELSCSSSIVKDNL